MTGPGREAVVEVLAVEVASFPEVVRELTARHVAAPGGGCAGCAETGDAAVWPCLEARIARRAGEHRGPGGRAR